MTNSIALLVDYENVPVAPVAQKLVNFAKRRGILTVCKAYKRLWEKLPRRKSLLISLGFSLVDAVFNLKNSADFRLMFDCLDLAQSQASPSIFILVTGDGDFAQLVTSLKALGKKVIVFSRQNSSSQTLKELADEFYYLEYL